MPKILMQDIFTGKELKDNMKYAESMRTQTTDNLTTQVDDPTTQTEQPDATTMEPTDVA
jgi:hypothetical protein